MPFDDSHYSSHYWRTIREQCLARDNSRCRLCNSPEALQAHHRTYERFGKEDVNDLTTLCAECHDLVTDHQRRQRYTTRQLPPVPEVGSAQFVYTFASSRTEVSFETNCEIPSRRGIAALDAQWATQRPAERMDQSD